MIINQILTNVEAKILFTLAIKGNRTYKQLREKDKVASNKTILNSLQKLAYMDLISTHLGDNEGIRGGVVGRKATYNSVTIDGLLLGLYYYLVKYPENQSDDELIKTFNQIAKKQKKTLPTIFGKWEFFKENNLNKEVIGRLGNAILNQGPVLEQIVKGKRYQMKKRLEKKKETKEMLDYFKEFLNSSEIKKLPKDPVFMTEKEKEEHLRVYFKIIKRSTGNEESFGNSAINELLKATKTIDQGYFESSLRQITAGFLFASKNILPYEKQENFLKIISKDKELRSFAIEYLEQIEVNHKQIIENIGRYKKNLI